MNTILLLGFMGAGKTTVAKVLAERTGCQALDTDALIEEKEGRSIAAIFKEDGEEAFRDKETQILRDLASKDLKDTVISVGGGLPVREENRFLMNCIGRCFYLKAPAEVLARRLRSSKNRPLLKGKSGPELEAYIQGKMAKREESYLAAADTVVETAHFSVPETADAILALMRADGKDQT